MNDEKWEQLKENLKKKFEIADDRTQDLMVDTGDGPVKQGTEDILVVRTHVGEIKLEREVRPKILEKKFHYTHRQGQSAQTEYILSNTEKTYKLRIFKWNDLDNDWKEIDVQNVSGLF